jgi:hypothetical protein
MTKEVADLMHKPEADGGNIHVLDDVGVKVDVPLFVDGQRRHVDSLPHRITRLIDHNGIEGEEGAGEIRRLVGGPDPRCSPGPPWLSAQSFKG